MLFDDGLILLVNAQIHRKQRSAVGKEALRVEQSIFQMVVPHIRLGEGGIDEVVCGGVLPFQKEFGGELIVRLQEVDFGIIKLYILHILHKLAVIVVPKDEFTGIGKFSIQPVYDLFDVHFCHAALLLLVYDYPRPTPVGAFAFDFASFLKAIHEPLHSGKGNSQHLYNIFLRYFWIGSEDAQNRFFIGVIGFNFGVIGVTLFGVNDTILIGSRVFPIQVDAEIAAHINQFRLTKSIFLCFPEHFRDSAAPCLHDVHVGKGGCDTTVADL